MADSVDFTPHVQTYYGELPHPQSQGHPPIPVKNWDIAVSLATAAKFGGNAAPHEVDLFWPQFQQLGMQPRDFLDTLNRLAKWSFRYHNQPPSMKEIAELAPQKPQDQHKYYQDLPHAQFPDVTAGQMMKAHAIADQYSKKHLGKGATMSDARFVHHANMGPDQVDKHFEALAKDSEAKKAPVGTAEPF